jgi:hypothetical protein
MHACGKTGLTSSPDSFSVDIENSGVLSHRRRAEISQLTLNHRSACARRFIRRDFIAAICNREKMSAAFDTIRNT